MKSVGISVIEALFFTGFALLGRWVQLHPERVAPKGHFIGPDTFGARLFRTEVAVVGTVAVLGSTWATVRSLFSLLTTSSAVLTAVMQLAGLAAGAAAAIYVRKEVSIRPPYVSASPYGWWP